jgi:hypothetical protein
LRKEKGRCALKKRRSKKRTPCLRMLSMLLGALNPIFQNMADPVVRGHSLKFCAAPSSRLQGSAAAETRAVRSSTRCHPRVLNCQTFAKRKHKNMSQQTDGAWRNRRAADPPRHKKDAGEASSCHSSLRLRGTARPTHRPFTLMSTVGHTNCASTHSH